MVHIKIVTFVWSSEKSKSRISWQRVQGLKYVRWLEVKTVTKDATSENRNIGWSKGYLELFFPQNNEKIDLVSTERKIMTNQDREG